MAETVSEPVPVIDMMRRIVKDHQAEARCQACGASSWEWAFYEEDDEGTCCCPACGEHALLIVDAFTASGIVQVYDALNEQNRERFISLPIPRMADVMWTLVR